MVSVGKARWLPGPTQELELSDPPPGLGRHHWLGVEFSGQRPMIPSVTLSRSLQNTVENKVRGALGLATAWRSGESGTPQLRPRASLPPGCPDHILLEQTVVQKSTSEGVVGTFEPTRSHVPANEQLLRDSDAWVSPGQGEVPQSCARGCMPKPYHFLYKTMEHSKIHHWKLDLQQQQHPAGTLGGSLSPRVTVPLRAHLAKSGHIRGCHKRTACRGCQGCCHAVRCAGDSPKPRAETPRHQMLEGPQSMSFCTKPATL